jgi:hypothetical protein
MRRSDAEVQRVLGVDRSASQGAVDRAPSQDKQGGIQLAGVSVLVERLCKVRLEHAVLSANIQTTQSTKGIVWKGRRDKSAAR